MFARGLSVKNYVLAVVGIVLAVILALTVAGRPNPASAKSPDSNLVGAWQVDNNITGGPVLKSLITFSPGGGVVESEAVPVTNQPQSGRTTTGHGVWVRTGERKFTVKEVILLIDPQGRFAGTLKPTAKIKLSRDSNSFEGPFMFVVTDPSGKVVQRAHGVVKATRIRVGDH